MAQSFKNNSGKSAFGVFSESQNAGEYIYNKKVKNILCNTIAKTNNQSELLLLKKSQLLKYDPLLILSNKTNLNINLITKLNLLNIPVIQNIQTQKTPTNITIDSIPYLNYNIDPKGYLFGNSICGINNYTKYMIYNPNNPPNN